jgi:hypothetical protein
MRTAARCSQSRSLLRSFTAPSEVCSPSTFFQSQGATPPGSPNSPGCVPPSGFLALSVFCSPRDLSSLFHLESALGVRPPRLYSSRVAVRSLERRPPPVVLSSDAETPSAATPGFDTPRKFRPGPWGLARCPTDASLGFFSSEVSSPLWLLQCRSTFALPSRALFARPQADRTIHASGFLPSRGQPLSLDSDVPLWSFLPRRPSQLFVDADALGYPSADPPCHHDWRSPLCTPSSPAGAH